MSTPPIDPAMPERTLPETGPVDLPLAGQLWSRLRGAGLVSADTPPAEDDMPWYLAALIGIAAWGAALLLAGFLFSLFGDWLDQPTPQLVLGTGCAVVALALLRRFRGREFFEQAGTALALLAQLLIGMGLHEALRDGTARLGDGLAWALLGGIALALYVLGTQTLHRFVCGVVLCVSLLGLSWSLLPRDHGPALLTFPVMAWAAALLWRRSQSEDRVALALPPLAWAFSLTAIGLAWWSSPSVLDLSPSWKWAWMVSLALVAALLPATAWVTWRRAHAGAAMPLWALLPTLLFAGLGLLAPGIALGATLVLIGAASLRKTLIGVGAICLAVYLAHYYYQLSVPLLEKSIWLGASGAALLGARALLRRRASGETT